MHCSVWSSDENKARWIHQPVPCNINNHFWIQTWKLLGEPQKQSGEAPLSVKMEDCMTALRPECMRRTHLVSQFHILWQTHGGSDCLAPRMPLPTPVYVADSSMVFRRIQKSCPSLWTCRALMDKDPPIWPSHVQGGDQQTVAQGRNSGSSLLSHHPFAKSVFVLPFQMFKDFKINNISWHMKIKMCCV